MKIKMNKIHDDLVKGCFCNFDGCGRLYLGRHQNGSLSFTITEESGDTREVHIDEQIPSEDIMLFQICCFNRVRMTGMCWFSLNRMSIK